MDFDDADRRRLAARARTLHERLQAPNDASPRRDVESVEGRVEAWAEFVAGGDEQRFEERLDQLGLSAEACRDRLERGGWPRDEPVPSWVDEIGDLLAHVSATSVEEIDPVTGRNGDRLPFEEVVTAVVEYAEERIEWDTTELAPSGIEDLRLQLIARLQTLCAHSLFVEFKTYVAERDRELALADDPPTPDDPREHYERFVATLFDGGLVSFFLEYAFLARRLAATIRQWTDVVEEFTSRLSRDRPDLRGTVADGEDLGRVTAVEGGGDLHARGRTTMDVRFESGARVAYKPRDVAVASAFSEVVAWVNERVDGPTLRAPRTLVRDGYGWMEWIEHEPCPDDAAVERFYRRTGGLICLLYALRFSDGHFENLVAAGDQPVLVDLETLARPPSPGEGDENRIGSFREGTVLETSLLPERTDATGVESPSDEAVPDIGGFGTAEASWTGLQIPEFTDVNTDLMELVYREEDSASWNNLPTIDGATVDPADYAAELVDGFEMVHEGLREHRSALLADDGPISAFEGAEVRFLTRPTRWYGKVLRQGQTPSELRSGLAFGCRMELLAKALVAYDEPEVTEDVYRAERTALCRRDIPRFAANTDDRALRHDGAPIDGSYFDETALAALERRIRRLDREDLATQRDYLSLAYRGRLPKPTDAPTEAPAAADPPATVDPVGTADPPAAPDSLDPVETARHIFDRIVDDATRTTAGDRTWVLEKGLDGGFTAELIGDDLYQGRIGLGLFAAALHRATGDATYREFVDDVVEPVVATAQDGPRGGVPLGFVGDGSIVYGCTAIGRLLDEDSFFALAADAAGLLTPDRLHSDPWYDLTQGSAGAILGLLALHEATGEDRALRRATIAGDHLLSSRIDVSGCGVWSSHTAGEPLQGAAHGVAGIAYALSRLAEATGDERYRTAALESLAYEERLYDADSGTWGDVRDGGAESTYTWCHGNAGIGLTRLGMAEVGTDGRVSRDVERALAGVDPATVMDVDHCCCGNFGRVEFLLEASARRDGDYESQARSLAQRCASRARETGRFRGPFTNERLYDPTFFMGEAGIGYSLLRLEDPSLPCVLLLE